VDRGGDGGADGGDVAGDSGVDAGGDGGVDHGGDGANVVGDVADGGDVTGDGGFFTTAAGSWQRWREARSRNEMNRRAAGRYIVLRIPGAFSLKTAGDTHFPGGCKKETTGKY
jgi:hypothetical protein